MAESERRDVVGGRDGVSGSAAPASVLTSIDSLMEIIQTRKVVTVRDLADQLHWGPIAVERIARLMERRGLVEVQFPATMIQSPRVVFKKALPAPKALETQGKVIEGYSFKVDFVPVEVRILQSAEDRRPFYFLNPPAFGVYTRAFLEEVKNDIVSKVPVEANEISDLEKNKELKQRFFEKAREELQNYLVEMNEALVEVLSGMLLHLMYGLGDLELLVADDWLEEVAINSSKTPVTVYHLKYGWMKSNISMGEEETIFNYSAQIARKVGREITTLNPILDAHLLSGDRVNATLFPISSFGNTITIRKFARRPWTIVDFIGKNKTMTLEMASWLWLAMQYEMNIIFAGSTASGKTSALNALSAFIPSHQRIVSIEDVREIMLPEYMQWNWVPLTTRNPNPEGSGEVNMLDLLYSSLRMRPDRIILGEMRRHEEAEVLFEAMHTGHSVYSTLHADSSRQVLRRLIEPPLSIPAIEVEAIDLVVVQYRDRRMNIRRTYEISEIEAGQEGEGLGINTVFRWVARSDSWDKANEPVKLMQRLNIHTGLTQSEIETEIMQREKILQWMVEHNLNDINLVGTVMRLFYSSPEELVRAVEKGRAPGEVLL